MRPLERNTGLRLVGWHPSALLCGRDCGKPIRQGQRDNEDCRSCWSRRCVDRHRHINMGRPTPHACFAARHRRPDVCFGWASWRVTWTDLEKAVQNARDAAGTADDLVDSSCLGFQATRAMTMGPFGSIERHRATPSTHPAWSWCVRRIDPRGIGSEEAHTPEPSFARSSRRAAFEHPLDASREITRDLGSPLYLTIRHTLLHLHVGTHIPNWMSTCER